MRGPNIRSAQTPPSFPLTSIQISTQAPNPNQRPSSFEPLAILLAIPLLFRLLPRRVASASPDDPSSTSIAAWLTQVPDKPISQALDPALDPDMQSGQSAAGEQSLLLSAGAAYDAPNTYLTPEAQGLPERQCTLCLEPRGTGEGSGGTVGVTECGHVFCWGCLGGLEKVSRRGSYRVHPSALDQVR